jgi:putative (di)nucleoside polyphosphate hydrolase
VLGRTADWIRYRLPRQYVRRNASPVCIGQKQRWFLLRFQGRETDLRFDRTLEPPEFDRWRWVEYWDPVREVIWFKRDVYRRALHELGRIAFPVELPPYPDWWHATGDRPPTRTRA